MAAVYKLGWKLGCKGMTVYVTGSRDKVVLETHATVQAKQKDEAVMPVEALQTPQLALMDHAVHAESALPLTSAVVKKDRPRELIGRTFQVGTPLGKTYAKDAANRLKSSRTPAKPDQRRQQSVRRSVA